MAKYDPLRDELTRIGAERIAMSFADLEQLVGALPASAWNFPWWWASEDHQTTWHVQCKAWGEAGYSADVDLMRHSVTFI